MTGRKKLRPRGVKTFAQSNTASPWWWNGGLTSCPGLLVGAWSIANAAADVMSASLTNGVMGLHLGSSSLLEIVEIMNEPRWRCRDPRAFECGALTQTRSHPILRREHSLPTHNRQLGGMLTLKGANIILFSASFLPPLGRHLTEPPGGAGGVLSLSQHLREPPGLCGVGPAP